MGMTAGKQLALVEAHCILGLLLRTGAVVEVKM